MNFAHSPSSDELISQWLLEVASRADELTQAANTARDSDRRIWLRAEFEIFERVERARRFAVLATAA